MKFLKLFFSLGGSMRTAGGDSLAAEAADGEDLSLMPPQVKEIMIRLQSENKHLKDQSERELNRTTVDKAEFHEQIETLTAEKQQYHDKVAELEALVLSGNSTGEQNTEEIQELQEKLQKSKEEDSGRKEEIANLNNILNESKEKGDEFQALLKQKEEDIKVKNRTPFNENWRLNVKQNNYILIETRAHFYDQNYFTPKTFYTKQLFYAKNLIKIIRFFA